MSWSYWFCDTITGEKLTEVEPSAGSWSRRLNVAESGSHQFVLTDVADRDEWRDITTPWARTLVQCWDDVPVYAGLITGRPYSRDKHMLTVETTDLRALFRARYPFGSDGYWADEGAGIVGNLTITSKSPVSAVGLVLNAALSAPVTATASYDLPLVLPSLVSSGSFSAVYDNFNFQTVADVLSELQEMDGGPDVEFAPQWSTGDTLEWVTRAGALTGNDFDFYLATGDSPVSSVQFRDDALKQVTGVFGIGQGFGADMIVGGTTYVSVAAIPARDEVSTWRMVKSIPHAAAMATERLAAYKYATIQPSLTVLASEVDPTSLILGSTVNTFESGDFFYPDGESNYRLVGLSGGVGLELKLSVQGVRE